MTKIGFKVDSDSGVLRAAVVPDKHSGENRFGLLDGTVIAFFLLCVAGLVYLVMQ